MTPLDARLEALSRERLEAGIDAPPERVYALFHDEYSAPALYLEASIEESDPPVPVIVHNLRYYEEAMRRWDAGFVDLLVLNELHELTHWAMTDAERERFERKSRRYGRPDGHWLNPVLFDAIEWLPGRRSDVFEPEATLAERVVSAIRRLFGDSG